jgi:hypothetical protein
MNRAIAYDYSPTARPMVDRVEDHKDVTAYSVFAQPDRIYNRGQTNDEI